MSARIVLADDSITIQKVIGLTFASEDFALQSFDNGSEALDAIKANRPDLVIADTDMPGLNGFELCAEVKRLNPSTPVILLHTTYDAFDTNRAQAVGADYASPKPFDSAELLSHIRRLLQAASNGASAIEEFAEVEPIEELEELGDIAPIEDEQPAPPAVSSTAPAFTAIEDDSGLLSNDVFGELGEGDLVTSETQDDAALEPIQEELSEPIPEALSEPTSEFEELNNSVPPIANPVIGAPSGRATLWDLGGFEPYQTAGRAVAPSAAAPVPEPLPEVLEEHAEELDYEEPMESVESIEAEAATLETPPQPETAQLDGPDFSYVADEVPAEPDLTAAAPDEELGGPDFSYVADEAPVEPDLTTPPAAQDSVGFTSIADSMYDMAGMDSVVKATVDTVTQPQLETHHDGESSTSVMDEFEAFAAAADEPSLGSAGASSASDDSGRDPFSEFASYAQDSQSAVETTTIQSTADAFAEFSAAHSASDSAATLTPAPESLPSAPASFTAPTDEQIQVAVAAQVRNLVEVQLADQIRVVVAQAVENALEEVLAKLRERLHLP